MQTLHAHVADNDIRIAIVVTVDEEVVRQFEVHLRRPLGHRTAHLRIFRRKALIVDHTHQIRIPVPPLCDGEGQAHIHRIVVQHGHIKPRETNHTRVDAIGNRHLLYSITDNTCIQRDAVFVGHNGRHRIVIDIRGVKQRITNLVSVVRDLHAVGRKVPESRA